MKEVKLIVDGKEYGGWTAVEINFSMQTFTQTFSFTSSNTYPDKPQNWEILPGLTCIIKYDDAIIMKGWIEDLVPEYDAENYNMKISGRDPLCDLVDCTRYTKPTEWLSDKGYSIDKTIRALIAPHPTIKLKIDSCVSQAVLAKAKNFKVEDTSTVSDMITKVCHINAVLPLSYGDGNLTLTRSGYGTVAKDRLKTGYNILKGKLTNSNKERYSLYVVKGQSVAEELQDIFSTNQPERSTTDEIVSRSRYRPLTIVAEGCVNSDQCYKSACWEATIRAGNSRKLEYEVQGWTQHNGDLWTINSLVQVEDKTLGVNKQMLIESLTFTMDNTSGTKTIISLVDKKTYDLVATPLTKMDMTMDIIEG